MNRTQALIAAAGSPEAMLASALIALSAGLSVALGFVHLAYTFRGSKLHPRDSELRSKMENTSPVLTRRTTMWKAWIGFNASHSLGIILFGAIYGYFALAQSQFLFRSPFLLLTGLVTLAVYAYLGKRYWFSSPFRWVLVVGSLYVAGMVVGLT